ncbi:MAG: flagellar type III secretion system pore protein FliP [Candidatus Margulisbacteria bacterium]|nr:flagellar type III secretion system pore protein FliP [Candidatus Margulisiibacteriota bacterium]
MISIPQISLAVTQSSDPGTLNSALQMLILLTILSLAPSIIILFTSFTRIIIVLGFIRNALSTQQTPPTQVLVGIALFLTFLVMAPVAEKSYNEGIKPYTEGKITQELAIQRGMAPVREFMFKQTRKKDLLLFVRYAKLKPLNKEDIPTHILVASFVISELKTAFQMGFVLFIPFLIIDIVIASVLMSMGMMMLPPVMISLPFKILLFLLVDGWNLIVRSLLASFG